jgi:ketosteroid isomerase-like protein
MSAGREALIRRQWERWNAGDRESHMGEIAEDFVVESVLTGRTFEGPAGLADWMAEIDESFESWRTWIDEVREVTTDRYLVLGGVHLRGRGSGVEFDQPIGWVVDFSGDRVARLRNLADHDAAIAAVDRD